MIAGRLTPEVDVDPPAAAPPPFYLRAPAPAPSPQHSVFTAPLSSATPIHAALQQASNAESRPQQHAVSPGLQRAFYQQHPLLRAQQQAQQPWHEQQEAQRRYGLQQQLEQAYNRRVAAQTGKGGALDLGFINLTPAVSALATAHLIPQGGGVLGTLGKVANEAIDMPAQTFLSGAIAGNAAREALGGNFGPGGQIVGSFAHQITHPVESFEEAPLSTALLLAGGENVLGRLGGKLGRAVAPADSAVGRALALQRPDLQLLGPDNAQTLRTYNTDPLRMAAQKAYEKGLTSPLLPEGVRQADPFVAEGWRLKRNLVGTTFKPGVADQVANAQEAVRRGWLQNTAHAAAEAHPGDFAEHVLPQLILQRAVRTPATAIADLQKVRGMWADAQPGLKGSKLAANKENVGNLDRMLADPAQLQAHLPAAFDSAARLQAIQGPQTAVRVAARQLEPGQLRAGLMPYAQVHMGAVPHSVADHQALEQEALVAERAATQRVAAAVPGSSEHANATIDELAARQHRYEVSGRGADLHAEHEAAIGQHAEAAGAVKRAEARVASEEAARGQLVRQQRTNRGADTAGTGGAVRGSSAADVAAKDLREQKLAAAKAGLVQARKDHAAARDAVPPLPKTQAALRTAEGKNLPNEAILAHMAEHGLTPPGYLSHEVGVKGNRSFYQAVSNLPSPEKYLRTGASFANGTADHSWQAMLGTLAKGASKAAKIEARVGSLRRLGIGGANGAFFEDPKAAAAAIENLSHTTSGDQIHHLGEFVPVHAGSGQVVKATDVHPHTELGQVLSQFGLAHHTDARVADNGRYVLMHKGVAERLRAHEDAMTTRGDVGKALQLYQQGFRHAKLNTSIPHIAGVVQEQAIRLGAEGVAPAIHVPQAIKGHNVPVVGGRSFGGFAGRAGGNVTRNLVALAEKDTHGMLADSAGPLGADFRRLEGQLANRGGLAGSQKALDVQRVKGNQFQSALGQHGIGLAEGASNTLPGKAVRAGWKGWSAAIEGGLSKVEHATRDALLGKALKDSGLIPSYRAAIKMQDTAMQQWLAGTLTPARADALARMVDNMGGNWNRQTPFVRQLVGKFAPFGLWWLNSMRWLYRLPVTHPVKTAIAAGLYQATREQRGAKGQGFDAAHPVPAFLQGEIETSLPLAGKVGVDPTHYSPGGTGGPEALHTFVEQFMPALKGIYAGAEGVNPLSKRVLTTAQGKPLGFWDKVLNVLGEGVAGPVPGSTQFQKVVEQGGKPYGTANVLTDAASLLGGPSQVKPGTERGWPEVAAKLISPLRFNFPSHGTGEPTGGGAKASGLSPAELTELREAAKGAGGRGGSAFSPAEQAEIKRAVQESGGERKGSAWETPQVEPGVTGKERLFQINRLFGPGAMTPYLASPPPAEHRNDLVYRGGRRGLRQGPPPQAPNVTRGIVRRRGEMLV